MGLLEQTEDRKGRWPTRRHLGQRRVERDDRPVTHGVIQTDVFDHLLAIRPSFARRVHQRPGSADLAALGSRDQAAPAGGITG
jgi:hypothetical protein